MSKESKKFSRLNTMLGVIELDNPMLLSNRQPAGVYLWADSFREVLYISSAIYDGFIQIVHDEELRYHYTCYGDGLRALLGMKLASLEIRKLMQDSSVKFKEVFAAVNKITGGAATLNNEIGKFDVMFDIYTGTNTQKEGINTIVVAPMTEHTADGECIIRDVIVGDGAFRRIIFPTILGNVSLTCYDDQVANPGIVIKYENEKLEQFVENFVLAGDTAHKLLFKGGITALVEEKYKTVVSYLDSIAGEAK